MIMMTFVQAAIKVLLRYLLRRQIHSLRAAHKADVDKLKEQLEGGGGGGGGGGTDTGRHLGKRNKERRHGQGGGGGGGGSIPCQPENQNEKKSRVSVTDLTPIGCISSWYKTKNGTPRQPTVCKDSR